MKQAILLFITATVLFSCGSNQSKSQSDAKQLATDINKMMPGGIPATAGGWTMTAKFDGKDWSANSLMPLEVAGRIFGENNGVSISLPYDRREMKLGYKNKFSDHNAVDIFTKDDVTTLWGGYAGEMEITKVDGEWVEGKFTVIGSAGSSSDKKLEVTDGFFRISMAKQ